MPSRHRITWIALLSSFLVSACAPSAEVEAAENRLDSTPRDREPLPGVPGKELAALGYSSFVIDEIHEGDSRVLSSDPERCSPGVTVFGSGRKESKAYLFDLEGNEVHRWEAAPTHGRGIIWQQLSRDGDLLTVGRRTLYKMAPNGEILWEAPEANYHHDVTEDSEGRVHGMVHRRRPVEHRGREVQVTDDIIVSFEPDGTPIGEVSMLDLLGPERIATGMLDHLVEVQLDGQKLDVQLMDETLAADNAGDVFHMNSVDSIDRDIGVAGPGTLLVCLRTLNLVLIIDPISKSVVWEWTAGVDELDRPHRPALLENDNFLIFDNGWLRGYSRVIELDPRTGELVWQYMAPHPETFFTKRGGMAQVLPNDNVLITEADRGHVFEVTREGEVVWDFLNPEVEESKGGRRKTIYRAWRWGADDLGKLDLGADLESKMKSLGYFQ